MKCEQCDKEFKSEAWLKNHMAKFHAEQPVEPAAEEVVKEAPKVVHEPEHYTEEVIVVIKGWKIIKEGNFKMVNREGQVVGHYADKTEAIRQLENMTRHVR